MSLRPHRLIATLCLGALVLAVSGCGGGSKNTNTAEAPLSPALREGARSLQAAMTSVSGEIDGMRSTRDSLDRLGATLQPAISQTSDVIGLLAPKGTSGGAEGLLLKGARQQRSFLQFAADAAASRQPPPALGPQFAGSHARGGTACDDRLLQRHRVRDASRGRAARTDLV